jgi:hypothetical protein
MRLILALLLGMTCQAAMAHAASFDGHWTGSADHGVGQGCSWVHDTWDLLVANGNVKGTTGWAAANESGQLPVQGSVSTDGKMNAHAGSVSVSGQFSDDSFSGDVHGQICTFRLHLQRAQ